MEEWQEKDRQQQFSLLDKQKSIDKLDKMVDNLERQLSAKINRYVQWKLFDTCVTMEVMGRVEDWTEFRIGLISFP